MVTKKIRLVPLEFKKDPLGGVFLASVSVASPSALVVIEHLAPIDDLTMMGVAVITEDVDE